MALPVGEIDLSGLIDLHIHAAPDVRPRYADDVDLVTAAARAGMRAVLLKSHVTLTADRASISEKVVGGIRAFGGLVLNTQVGGFNPAAVEAALQMGAKQIWMPTMDSAHHRRYEGKPGGLTIFTDEGRIRPEVHEIIELVREADVILGTGHLAIEETAALVRLARQRGLRKIVVTHPEARFIRMPVEAQMEMAAEGVFFERCYIHDMARPGVAAGAEIAAQIRKVGVDSTVLATDFGQAHNPAPVDGMRAYITALNAQDFTNQELRHMASENPAHLLGL